MTAYPFETLFPNELQTRLEASPMLVIPLGTIEWHSYHMPVGMDGIAAQHIGTAIANQCDAVLAPMSYWAAGGVAYPYTLKLPVEIVETLYTTLFAQFAEMGFKVITAFTGHFGIEQTLALKRAAFTAMQHASVTILPLTPYDLVSELWKGDHAAVGETALLQAISPDHVRLNTIPLDEKLDGILGDDPRTTSLDGQHLLNEIVSRAADVSRRLLSNTSSVQRSRYVEVLGLAVKVLKKTYEQRQIMPKSLVPSITSPAYLAYCQAIYAGDYLLARQYIERKLGDLSA